MSAKGLTVLCMGVLLSACASNSKLNDKPATVTGTTQSPAYSQGVGSTDNFNGQNSRSTALLAPHNQTYYFAFDNSTIKQNAMPSINAQARYLTQYPKAQVLLTGNTDERGSREYNIALGERRADAVAEILKLDGVKPNQMRIVSYGQEKPKAFGHDEAAYRLNRRVEFMYEAKS